MISQKFSHLFLISVLIISLVFSFLFTQVAFAQQNHTAPFCPIVGNFSIYPAVDGLVDGLLTVEDSFSHNFKISNGSDYYIPDVSIGIGFYESESDTVPNYWTVAENKVNIPPNSEILFPISLSLDSVPMGNYLVKAFMIQGDETAVLGAAIRDVANTAHLNLKKITGATSKIDFTFSVNETKVSNNSPALIESGEGIEFKVNTINNNDIPLINSNLNLSLTEAKMPLAGALMKKVKDSIKIIPGLSQESEMQYPFLKDGVYTIYATLITEGVPQPLNAIDVKVGEVSDAGVWPYVSIVGLSKSGSGNLDEVTACISYLGYEGFVAKPFHYLNLSFVIIKDGTEMFSNSVNNLEERKDFFFKTKINNLINNTLNLELSQNSGKLISEAENNTQNPINYFIPAQQLSVNFSCDDGFLCLQILDHADNQVEGAESEAGQESFWFYFGIVLSVLLLMYLMLGRLHTNSVKTEDVNSNLSETELQ